MNSLCLIYVRTLMVYVYFEFLTIIFLKLTIVRVSKTAVANSAIWPLTWVFWSLNEGL